MINNKIRNIAIIAHVDHGKTTLVNQMLKQSGVFRSNQVISDRVMDSNDLEKERGITILAKNTSINYKDYKINIVDTPGHADFGGEVERTVKMVDGVLLLVDAFEGIMPQTRFVLSKALEMNHKIIIIINKIDRQSIRVNEVIDEILELLISLGADEKLLDSKFIFCSARQGIAGYSVENMAADLTPLFEAIIENIPAPTGDENLPFKMLVSALDYNDYIGNIAIGKITSGTIKENQNIILVNYYDGDKKRHGKISKILQFEGLNRVAVPKAGIGDIICLSGIDGVNIGDTLTEEGDLIPIYYSKISEPTVEMTFAVNDSPFFGREGSFVTSTYLRERLMKESIKDASIKIRNGDSANLFSVYGRGEMHLSILIENMRREGYEFSIGVPKVIYKEINGLLHEPIDYLVVDVPDESVSAVMEKMGIRKGELVKMSNFNDRCKMEFKIPARGLFGYKTEFLTDTRGEGILSSVFFDYEPFKGNISRRNYGSLIATELGLSNQYGLYHAQERGNLFITPGTEVYEGMIVGYSPKSGDLNVNVCKKKKLTNMRSAASDEALRLTPATIMSLEQYIDFINDDELIEVTPKSIRARKKILNSVLRAKDFYGKKPD